MRWILHLPNGMIKRGEDAPPEDLEGVLHIIGGTPEESVRYDQARRALHKGGRRAETGTHRVPFRDAALSIEVTAKGRASRKPIERPAGGGKDVQDH